jgi:hypothetical protein
VSSSTPPTTRLRPLPSGVAVTCARGLAMLAVADQLPVAVLAEDPEANVGTVRAKNAQIANATNLVLTTTPPLPA